MASPGTISDPSDITLCIGDSLGDMASASVAVINTTLSSNGSTVSYQWQTRTNVAAGWQDIESATAAALDVSVTPVFVNSTTEVRRIAYAGINSVFCLSGGSPSNVVTITTSIDRAPVISVSSNPVCSPDITTMVFSVSTTGSDTGLAGGGVDTYQWLRNGSAISGAIDSRYTPSAGDFVDGDQISIAVSTASPFSCTVTSSVINVGLTDLPNARLDNNATLSTICAGQPITFTALQVSGANYIFKLNSGIVQNSSSNIYTTSSISGQSTVTVEVTVSGCSATATNTIFVPAVTTIGSITAPADVTLCPGSFLGTLGDGGSGAVAGTLAYQWQSNLGDGSGWQPLGTVTTTAAFDGSLLAINSTTSIRRLTLATLNGVSCSSPSNVVTVTTSVDRAPVISVSPSTAVCVSDITTMLFSVVISSQ